EENFLKTSKSVIEKKAEELGADEKQALTISEDFNNKVSIVTGYAGTGKRKTIEKLSQLLLEENTDIYNKICAPTGIADQNLQKRLLANKSSQIKQYFSHPENKCKTIHSLLEIMPASSVGVVRTKYSYNKNPLPADVVVVDET